MNADDAFRPVNLSQSEPFRWQGVTEYIYKADSDFSTFKDVTRRKLFIDPDKSGIELRYFEISPSGHTTLEKHDHIHLVVPIRGGGMCLVDNKLYKLELNDVIHVPSWAWHQFRANEDDYLGFLCLVTCDRDRPTLPTRQDLEILKKDPLVAEFIRTNQAS
ncbi:MAG: cupin domain-containing protein [Candidatus Nanopelagicaceae bacterium]|jgi:quercetin dioxygenase-like cupin family protein